jgi:regulatory protein
MARSPWQRPRRSTKPEVEGASGEDSGESPSSLRRSSKDSPESSPDAPAPKARRPSPRKIALDILARREHSVAELRGKLAARGEQHEWTAEEIEAALEALTGEGLLSEERFVENFVGSYTRRGHGPVWIRAELERRGISGEAIAGALASADTDWNQAAAEVRRKRFGAGPPADFKDRARQARFLQYRGFTPEQAMAATKGTGP